jgi:predicted SAM-dependent methyltransferase
VPEPTWKTALKTGLAAANRPVATARLRRVLADLEPPYRIQIGSGDRRLDGWLCTDIAWNARLHLDATKPWPVPDGSVSHVYADNVIEHVRMPAARSLLRHTLNALASGGAIRLATPDIERIARMYLADDETTQAHMERNRRAGYAVHYPVDLLTNTYTEAGHYLGYLWDWTALSTELRAAGYTDVQRSETGDSADPLFRDLEARTAPTEVAAALVVEARKP